MSLELYKSSKYCLISFDSTHQALEAEKLLKENNFKNIVVPTIREITSSCGLSIKVDCQQAAEINNLFKINNIIFTGFYQVEKIAQKNVINNITF